MSDAVFCDEKETWQKMLPLHRQKRPTEEVCAPTLATLLSLPAFYPKHREKKLRYS